MRTEATFQKALVKKMTDRGWIIIKIISQRNGLPDLLCKVPHRGYCFVEVKAYGGKLSGQQRIKIEHLRQAGCHVYVFYEPKPKSMKVI